MKKFDYPQVKFTDYMSLLKIDGEWKIISKTFYAEPKGQNREFGNNVEEQSDLSPKDP